MVRRIVVLGLVVTLISALAVVAAVQTSTDEAEAQVSAYELNYVCLDLYTSLYKGSFSASCPPGHVLLTLPDDYPLSLCASAYDGFLRAPNRSTGACPPGTLVRIELPSETPVNICYNYYTGRLSIATPYPNGSCGPAEFLVIFPLGTNEDFYQTLGNVDIDVPASDGVLSNDVGPGLMVTAFDATSANGGEVNVNPDGSFTYIPPAPDPNAFVGDDTFEYTVESSNGQSAVVTVTIQVIYPTVWFVDADAPTNGDGRRMTPFNDISVLNDRDLDPDIEGDFIFLYEAESIYPALTAFDLETDQNLIGQQVDLHEFLERAIEGTELMGVAATEVPPFIVTPEVDPDGTIEPVLFSDGLTLEMDDGTTAAGLIIASEFDLAVLADGSDDVTLDRVEVYGGSDGDGAPGVVAVEGSLEILGSSIYGGNGEVGPGDIGATTLQGFGAAGYGGDAVITGDTTLLVSNSGIFGGDGGLLDPDSGASERTLLGEIIDEGGDGGYGIYVEFFSDITVTDGSFVAGGTGSSGELFGGWGGDGIGGLDIITGISQRSDEIGRELQGPGGEENIPTIIVSGASTVQGGAGGDGDNGGGGDGGYGIYVPIHAVLVSETSSVLGGDGGDGNNGSGGDGGGGIFVGIEGIPLSMPATGSTLLGETPSGVVLLDVDASTVTGGDAGEATDGFGGYGGNGIEIIFFDFIDDFTGSSLQGGGSEPFIVSNVLGSTVTGGAGGDSDGDDGGNGGSGIVQFLGFDELINGNSSLQGPGIPFFAFDLDVDTSTVSGGPGGDSIDGEFAGFGGAGINNGLPELLFPGIAGITEPDSELQGPFGPFIFSGGNLTVDDSSVNGGAGGAGIEGFGGPGIVSFGIEALFGSSTSLAGFDPEELLDATISNTSVAGGAGGPGDDGSGGDAIAGIGMNIVVDQSSTATGGAGGDGGEEDFGGDGGYGIYAAVSLVLVDSATITGSAGGSSLDGPGGLGGEGIYLEESDLTVQDSSLVTGGAGGSGDALLFGAAPGGDGIYGVDSNVTITDSSATGGNGGSATPDEVAVGGDGGHGVHVAPCDVCNTLTAINATITGGNGGSSNDQGGNGGEGVIVENDDAFITGSMITGGSGGAGDFADGDGAAAILLEYEDFGDYTAEVQNNTLISGIGESGAQDTFVAVHDGSGEICINAVGNVSTNDWLLDNNGAGMLGITQADIPALSAANNGVTVNTSGTITFNCVIQPA